MSDTATIPDVKENGGSGPQPTLKQRRSLRPTTSPESKTKQQRPYSVVLHNDSINRFGWVAGVLQKTLGFGRGKAFLITLKAHCSGRGVVWVGPLEVAEFKAQQLVGVGPDPLKVSKGARPLKVTVEPTA